MCTMKMDSGYGKVKVLSPLFRNSFLKLVSLERNGTLVITLGWRLYFRQRWRYSHGSHYINNMP